MCNFIEFLRTVFSQTDLFIPKTGGSKRVKQNIGAKIITFLKLKKIG